MLKLKADCFLRSNRVFN